MTEWQDFYNSIKDPTWPDCDQIEKFAELPAEIQLEIVRDHLFNKRLEILNNNIRYIDNNIPNFLNYIEDIKQIIGGDCSLMNSQDVLFLYSLIWSKRPTNVLEIGRLYGWSTSVIYGALEDSNHGHLYTVDIRDITSPEIKTLLQSRTTFITQDSASLLKIPEIANKQFEIIFIDGNHEYDGVLLDLNNTYKITTSEAWILLHDADMVGVQQAITGFLSTVNNVTDCGVYGDKIRLLHKKEIK